MLHQKMTARLDLGNSLSSLITFFSYNQISITIYYRLLLRMDDRSRIHLLDYRGADDSVLRLKEVPPENFRIENPMFLTEKDFSFARERGLELS